MEINNRFLFKGKRIDNGEWVQGCYYGFMGKHYIFEQPFESDNLTHQIDESTICQCTGLRGKSEKLIFENDIHEEINTGTIDEANAFLSANAPKYPDAFWILKPCHMIL